MLRLSQKAWNNVLIISMLLMIVLFSSTHNILLNNADKRPDVMQLLPEDAVIMSLQIGAHKIERIGQGWRMFPSVGYSESTLAQYISHWQTLMVRSSSDERVSSPYVVVIWLAGEAKGRVFKLFKKGEQTYLSSQGHYYVANNKLFSQLIPEELQ
ncbi:hypothetical protein OE749_15785 [Aestuariibacter sp. AA17]|uniref:DUF4340 domain-containing protein n=1 Tax=Fluctibacter corallii TaxID=2984329 RepID=A0ABT3ABU4_9ALTE|nr:hypothetical protein [Aestuariibacter sp. AA17]MCV2886154.1 hypothetical protein [Aestuariibacter sp. AA17]